MKRERAQLSTKNPCSIPKHRYYELKHFCLQYPDWKKALVLLDGWNTEPRGIPGIIKGRPPESPTERQAIARLYYSGQIAIVDRCIEKLDPTLAPFILKGVTEGIGFEKLQAQGCPCCREMYYEYYRYAVPEGNPNNVRLMKKEEKQREMGVISNLITDMTLRGASEEELARAVKHSMVVIDAEKHKLDYKRSERENGIQELKEKWQIRVDEDGTTHYGGASTLLSRRKQTIRVPERRGSVRVDKETGELIYKESGRTFPDPKTKKERIAEDTVSLISETKDARTLSSGTIQENLYADFSNKLKAMAAQARKEAANMKGIQRDPEAAKTYAAEVMSLKDKYTTMLANKPKERKAMLIANANIKAKIQELGLDPQNTEDKKEIKKISSVEMQRARDKVGASGQKSKVRFSDREWEAIQAGAISDNMLSKFLNSSDSDEIVKRAMPKTTASLSSAKLSKARAMLRSGYTYKEIAQACGVPESTVYDALGK